MLTRAQKKGTEPMVKIQQKFRKKRPIKVHSNFLAMVLLMPLYAYMQMRLKLEAGATTDENPGLNESIKSYLDTLELQESILSDDTDDDVPCSMLLAREKLNFSNTSYNEVSDENVSVENENVTEAGDDPVSDNEVKCDDEMMKCGKLLNFSKMVLKNEYKECSVFKKSKNVLS